MGDALTNIVISTLQESAPKRRASRTHHRTIDFVIFSVTIVADDGRANFLDPAQASQVTNEVTVPTAPAYVVGTNPR